MQKYDVISILQDCGRDRKIAVPVSYLLMPLPSEGQSVSKPNFIEISQMAAEI